MKAHRRGSVMAVLQQVMVLQQAAVVRRSNNPGALSPGSISKDLYCSRRSVFILFIYLNN